jgi:hypothetical protein
MLAMIADNFKMMQSCTLLLAEPQCLNHSMDNDMTFKKRIQCNTSAEQTMLPGCSCTATVARCRTRGFVSERRWPVCAQHQLLPEGRGIHRSRH